LDLATAERAQRELRREENPRLTCKEIGEIGETDIGSKGRRSTLTLIIYVRGMDWVRLGESGSAVALGAVILAWAFRQPPQQHLRSGVRRRSSHFQNSTRRSGPTRQAQAPRQPFVVILSNQQHVGHLFLYFVSPIPSQCPGHQWAISSIIEHAAPWIAGQSLGGMDPPSTLLGGVVDLLHKVPLPLLLLFLAFTGLGGVILVTHPRPSPTS
jgi:hypothetical protein